MDIAARPVGSWIVAKVTAAEMASAAQAHVNRLQVMHANLYQIEDVQRCVDGSLTESITSE